MQRLLIGAAVALGFGALVALTGGCLMPGPHVPADLQGDVPIRVANKSSDPICALVMMPFDGQAQLDNWLGTSLRQEPIKAGEEREFKIKPGTYRFAVAACNSSWGAGTQQGKLEVQSATFVAIGAKAEAPPSYRLAFFPAVPTAQLAPQGGGGSEPAADEEPAADTSSSESSSSSSSSSSSASPSSSSSSSSAPKPAEGPACKADGTAITGNYSECCGQKTKLSADRTKTLCCSSGGDCN